MTSSDLRPVEEILESQQYSNKVKELIFAYWIKVREEKFLRTGELPGVLIGNSVAAKEMLQFKNVTMKVKNTIQINESNGSRTYIVRIDTPHAKGRGILCILNEVDIVGLKYRVDKVIL